MSIKTASGNIPIDWQHVNDIAMSIHRRIYFGFSDNVNEFILTDFGKMCNNEMKWVGSFRTKTSYGADVWIQLFVKCVKAILSKHFYFGGECTFDVKSRSSTNSVSIVEPITKKVRDIKDGNVIECSIIIELRPDATQKEVADDYYHLVDILRHEITHAKDVIFHEYPKGVYDTTERTVNYTNHTPEVMALINEMIGAGIDYIEQEMKDGADISTNSYFKQLIEHVKSYFKKPMMQLYPEKRKHVLTSVYNGLSKHLQSLKPKQSNWKDKFVSNFGKGKK